MPVCFVCRPLLLSKAGGGASISFEPRRRRTGPKKRDHLAGSQPSDIPILPSKCSIRALPNTGFSMRQSNTLPAECAGLKGQSGSVAAGFCCGATFPTIEL